MPPFQLRKNYTRGCQTNICKIDLLSRVKTRRKIEHRSYQNNDGVIRLFAFSSASELV